MKNGDKEIDNFMDDDNEVTLIDLCNKYFVLKQRFQKKDFKKMVGAVEIPIAPHDSNYLLKFKEIYNIELSIEEMIELRDFAENDYQDFMQDRINNSRNNGMSDVNLKGMF